MYIALGVLGILLVVGSGVTAMVAFVPPGDATVVATAEVCTTALGAGLAWAGLMLARDAGDYDVRLHGRRRPRPADVAAAVMPEVSFDCPECGRTYRASGQVVGRPFACRVCDARFTVPRTVVG